MLVSVAATAVSFALYATMWGLFVRAMLKRRGRPHPSLDRAPRVTIFKPLAGCDDDLEENLASFARIDYPSFEILFGVADSADPAFRVARAFIASHPKLDARVVVTDPHAAINPKVAQLIGLQAVATGELYVISDSNVRVRPTYLWSLVAELADERVGIVASLFAGTGERTLGAALENLQLCAATAPGLAAMDTVSRRPLMVGKSMAVRRRDLTRLGGFQPLGQVLAEDYVLGRRFLAAGFAARTSLEVVENRNVACSAARTIERHTRWAKMRRSLSPSAFAMEPVLTPIVVASAGVVIAPTDVDGRPSRGRLSGADGLCASRRSVASWSRHGVVVCASRDRALLRHGALLGFCVRQPADRMARAPVRAPAWKRHRPGPRFREGALRRAAWVGCLTAAWMGGTDPDEILGGVRRHAIVTH